MGGASELKVAQIPLCFCDLIVAVSQCVYLSVFLLCTLYRGLA